MKPKEKTRNVAFIFVGVIGLLGVRFYSGPLETLVHSHGANLTFSFGAYFILKFIKLPLIENKYMNGAYTFMGVSAQEIAQAFGRYPGIFDPLDFIANAFGICVAMIVDYLLTRGFTLSIQKVLCSNDERNGTEGT